MTDHSALIGRLEAGETGREIDAEIWCYLHGKRFKTMFERYDGTTQCEYTEPPKRRLEVTKEGIAAYTGSLDAALAHMVPEGWVPVDLVWRHRDGTVAFTMERLDPLSFAGAVAPTAAGAVCAAGLRARERADG